MKTFNPKGLTSLLLLIPISLGLRAEDKVVIQYDCIPNYANWGAVTAAYEKKFQVRVPPDMKGSSAALAALEAERSNPQADVAYYSGAIGFEAAARDLHQTYRPKGWERIPETLKDPQGRWFTVHTTVIAFIVNLDALKGRAIPQTWEDLLKPDYKGLVAYDDPTWGGTAFTLVYGRNILLGGSRDNFSPGLAYFKKLDENVIHYPRESIYNDVLRGEVPIWINTDGNGLKMKYVDKGNIEVVIPRDGTFSMPLVMGLVKGAPHQRRAQAYLDWLLSPEAQSLFGESFFRPVIEGSLSQNVVDKFPPKEAYSVVRNLSLADMAAVSEALKKAWLAEVKNNPDHP